METLAQEEARLMKKMASRRNGSAQGMEPTKQRGAGTGAGNAKMGKAQGIEPGKQVGAGVGSMNKSK